LSDADLIVVPGYRARLRNGVTAATEGRAKWLYFLVGQAGWYACVLSASDGVAWIGEAIVAALIIVHLLRVQRARQELKLLAIVIVIGWTWESLLFDLGLLIYPTSRAVLGLAPLWLPTLWALFAAQINTTYSWLKHRIALASLIGAIAGPLSFRAGAALGALRFGNPWSTSIALAAGWALLLPLIMVLARRWDGVRADPDPA
jgi:hypothetical protein